MSIAVISTSLNPNSKSELLANYVRSILESRGLSVTYINLKEWKLPFCDGDSCYRDAEVIKLNEALIPCDKLFVASPIYCYDVSATFKNLMELSKKAVWLEKKVGLLVSAAGLRSYLSPLGAMNSLMIDFRCRVTPRYVYSANDDFIENELSKDLCVRIHRLIEET